jgi:hypothetical protein
VHDRLAADDLVSPPSPIHLRKDGRVGVEKVRQILVGLHHVRRKLQARRNNRTREALEGDIQIADTLNERSAKLLDHIVDWSQGWSWDGSRCVIGAYIELRERRRPEGKLQGSPKTDGMEADLIGGFAQNLEAFLGKHRVPQGWLHRRESHQLPLLEPKLKQF